MRRTDTLSIALIALCLFTAAGHPALAGPNASAGCALDMGTATRDYSESISMNDIETNIEASLDDVFHFLVVAQNGTNLDTFNMAINYNASVIEFIEFYEEDPQGSLLGEGPLVNFLKSAGGSIFEPAMVTEDPPGKISIANAIKSRDDAEAPEGSGVLAILEFKVLDGDRCSKIELSNVTYMDPEGAGQIPQVEDSITQITNAFVNYKTICAVSDLADCPIDCTTCVEGIEGALTRLGECGEVKIIAGTYNEPITLDESITLILDDDKGAVEIAGSGSGL